MLKTYKYRIYPNEKQTDHLIQAMGCVRYIYNKALETNINHYNKTKDSTDKSIRKYLSGFTLCSTLLIEEKKKNEWLNLPNAQSLQQAILNQDRAFQNFFKGLTKYPKFKKKSNSQSLIFPQELWVDFEKQITKIPKCGKIKTIFDKQFEGKIKTCTVLKTPTNKFYIYILVDDGKDLPVKPEVRDDLTIGIDLGLTHFAILSNEEKIQNSRLLENIQARLKVLQRRAGKKKKGSNNKKKANLKVAKLHERITNKRKDFQQKLSTKIIHENQTIIVEDLNIAGMIKNHKLAGSISSVCWGEFVRQLKYKSEWYGKNFIQIGMFDPSSKTCSCCGVVNTELKLSDRYWACEACHIVHDRDINAAINIKNFGLLKAKSGQEMPVGLVEIPGSNKGRRSKKSIK